MATPQVYLILGCRGSDRIRVLSDLVEFGTSDDERSLVYHSTGDAEKVAESFVVKHRSASTEAYGFDGQTLQLELSEQPDLVFVVADGVADPSDFVEAFHAWLGESDCELARVVTVLNCDIAVNQGLAFEWFECCIHFSDIVLLARREKTGNKELKAYQKRFEDQYYPCLWEFVKKGRVANPSLVLDTQPRRITRIFDEPEFFEDDEEDEEEFEEDIAGDVTKDRFLKRVSGGKRALELPSIEAILED